MFVNTGIAGIGNGVCESAVDGNADGISVGRREFTLLMIPIALGEYVGGRH